MQLISRNTINNKQYIIIFVCSYDSRCLFDVFFFVVLISLLLAFVYESVFLKLNWVEHICTYIFAVFSHYVSSVIIYITHMIYITHRPLDMNIHLTHTHTHIYIYIHLHFNTSNKSMRHGFSDPGDRLGAAG